MPRTGAGSPAVCRGAETEAWPGDRTRKNRSKKGDWGLLGDLGFRVWGLLGDLGFRVWGLLGDLGFRVLYHYGLLDLKGTLFYP